MSGILEAIIMTIFDKILFFCMFLSLVIGVFVSDNVRLYYLVYATLFGFIGLIVSVIELRFARRRRKK